MARSPSSAREQRVSNVLRDWIADADEAGGPAAATLEAFLSSDEDAPAVFTDLNCILFRRCVESATRARREHVLRVGRTWLLLCPDLVSRDKCASLLLLACMEVLDDLKYDFSHEHVALDCLELLETLMYDNDFTEFSSVFLKVQRFSLDTTGRHVRRRDGDLALSAATCFVALRIMFKHGSKVLYDPGPALLGFFEAYERWPDYMSQPSITVDATARQVTSVRGAVIDFLDKHAIILSRHTSIFKAFRGDVLRAYHESADNNSPAIDGPGKKTVNAQEMVKLTTLTFEKRVVQNQGIVQSRQKSANQESIERVVETWAREAVAPIPILVLEALGEDPVSGALAKCILRGASARGHGMLVAALAEVLRAELDGAVTSLPLLLLDELGPLASDESFLDFFERADLVSEWAAGLLGLSSVTASRVCWFLGDAGARRGWRVAFDGIRAMSAVVTLTSMERRAVCHAFVKFALRDTQMKGTLNRFSEDDYRSLVLEALESMPVTSKDVALRTRARYEILHSLT